jgi:hypothetical protein
MTSFSEIPQQPHSILASIYDKKIETIEHTKNLLAASELKPVAGNAYDKVSGMLDSTPSCFLFLSLVRASSRALDT